VGNQQLSIHITRLLDDLKSSEFFARERCSRAVIPLPKNLSRKIARFFVSKIGPATGVRGCWFGSKKLHFQKNFGRDFIAVAVEGVKDRFHLIIPEIGILSFGNQVSEFLLPFNHVYHACSGPGLREVPVDTFQLSGSRKICICMYRLLD